MAQRRYGEWKNRNAANPTLDQTFSPQWVTDLDVSYRFDLGLTLSAGAINLFDSHPDKLEGAQLYGVPKYSITSGRGAGSVLLHQRELRLLAETRLSSSRARPRRIQHRCC